MPRFVCGKHLHLVSNTVGRLLDAAGRGWLRLSLNREYILNLDEGLVLPLSTVILISPDPSVRG